MGLQSLIFLVNGWSLKTVQGNIAKNTEFLLRKSQQH